MFPEINAKIRKIHLVSGHNERNPVFDQAFAVVGSNVFANVNHRHFVLQAYQFHVFADNRRSIVVSHINHEHTVVRE